MDRPIKSVEDAIAAVDAAREQMENASFDQQTQDYENPSEEELAKLELELDENPIQMDDDSAEDALDENTPFVLELNDSVEPVAEDEEKDNVIPPVHYEEYNSIDHGGVISVDSN